MSNLLGNVIKRGIFLFCAINEHTNQSIRVCVVCTQNNMWDEFHLVKMLGKCDELCYEAIYLFSLSLAKQL